MEVLARGHLHFVDGLVFGSVNFHSLYLSLFSFLFVTLAGSGGILGGKSLVLLLDLVELLHVLKEVLTSLEGDEKFSFLAVTSRSLHSDGSRSNLLEFGVIVSKIKRYGAMIVTLEN